MEAELDQIMDIMGMEYDPKLLRNDEFESILSSEISPLVVRKKARSERTGISLTNTSNIPRKLCFLVVGCS